VSILQLPTNDVEFDGGAGLPGAVCTDRLDVTLVIKCQRLNYQRRHHVAVHRLRLNLDSIGRLQLSLTFVPVSHVYTHTRVLYTAAQHLQAPNG